MGIILVSGAESNSVNVLALFIHHFKCLVVLLHIRIVEKVAQKVLVVVGRKNVGCC